MIKYLMLSCWGLLMWAPVAAQIKINNLRCELLHDPIGVDGAKPRLSWEITSETKNTVQVAYRILVASSNEKLADGIADVWDSGKKYSGQSIFVNYNGNALKKNTYYFWKVKTWTNRGETDWSKAAFWEMGLLNYKDWAATQVGPMPYKDWGGRWIGFDRRFPWDGDVTNSRLSARYFRKEFPINKSVKSATAYIIGLGLYELYINGQKVGKQVLSPVPTDYTKNVKYNTFDVTDNVVQGQNALGIALGNGLYFTMRQNIQQYKIKNFGFPKLLFNLIINYTDGSTQTIYSDDTWKGTADGPIRANNEYDGEEYDATREMPGWNKPNFDEKQWLTPEYVQEPGGNYEAQMSGGMKIMDSIRPIAIKELPGKRYILDMGQNITGWLKIKAKGARGQQVKLRYAESLDKNGELFVANLRDAKASGIYTLKGEGVETWEPSFVYYGFRYVEISNYNYPPALADFSGKMVYDDVPTVGSFTTSDSTINRIYKNAWWGISGNYKGMPVDCPQRNEREPWLGDRGVGTYGENFIFDNAHIYQKLLNDMALSQKADGALPDVAPDFWRYYSDNMTWPGVMLPITDMLYTHTGDISVVYKTYPVMYKWLRYMKDRYMNSNYILTKDSYGDWCKPPATIAEGMGVSANQKFPSTLIATAYYYYLSQMMAKFAQLQGKNNDVVYFNQLSGNIKKAFNNKFYNATGFYGTGNLTENLLPVSFGLVPQQNFNKVFHYIENTIMVTNNGHLSTGLVGTQWLMRTLTNNGRGNIALTIARQRTYPSWGYMIENGATTIWELWNGNTAAPDMNSQNHVMMLGDLVVWFYECLAGIKPSFNQPGFKYFILEPDFVTGLDYIKASYHSIHGLIKSEWKRENNKIAWAVSIPPNTTAELYIPAKSLNRIKESGRSITAGSGIRYRAKIKQKVVLELPSGDYKFEF